ncbi:hypothetical protein ACFLYO_01565 [Chloroflexota bacterium]
MMCTLGAVPLFGLRGCASDLWQARPTDILPGGGVASRYARQRRSASRRDGGLPAAVMAV